MTARVLVVDDVPANVKLLEARLSAEYFDVITAMSGAEALAICERAECDLVLLDVMMPDMDGFEVCRRLKTNPATHHIPVVMVTALDQPSDKVRGPGSRRRRFPDQADPRTGADRARALAGAAENGHRRTAHAGSDLARNRHRIAGTRGGGRHRPRWPRADRRRSAGLLRAHRRDACPRSMPSRSKPTRTRRCSMPPTAITISLIVSLGLENFDALRLCSQIRSLDRTRNCRSSPSPSRTTTRAWCAGSKSA